MKNSVKKFSLIAFLFISISFFGCEEEETQEMFDQIDDQQEQLYSEEKEKTKAPE